MNIQRRLTNLEEIKAGIHTAGRKAKDDFEDGKPFKTFRTSKFKRHFITVTIPTEWLFLFINPS